MSQGSVREFVEKLTQYLVEKDNYTRLVMPKEFKLIKAEKGVLLHEFVVEKKHLNLGNSLHGGFIALLVDIGGTLAISSLTPNFGVSADINISYLNGTKEGELIKVESKIDKIGKNLCFTSVKLFKEDKNGKEIPIAIGRHTKFIAMSTKAVLPSKL